VTVNLTRTLGWRLLGHARERAAELGYSRAEVLLAAAEPEVTYIANRYPGRAIHQRGDVAVVCWPADRVVCTVLLRTEQRWEHGRDVRVS